MEIHVSSKNIILVFPSRSNRDENNCKGPKLLKVRDNNDQLCKEVDLYVINEQSAISLQINSISMKSRVTNSTDPMSS